MSVRARESVCVCFLELAELCFPFLIRLAQSPAARSMEGREGARMGVCEGFVCAYLFWRGVGW